MYLYVTIMMTFCRKSVHSFLGLTIPINLDTSSGTSVGCSGLGLISATDIDSYRKPPHVVESTTFKSSSSSSSSSSFVSPPPSPLFIQKDPRGIGFIDDVGGGVNGLMSCTESLGFESCDERRVDDDEIGELCSRSWARSGGGGKVNGWKKNSVGERREVKKFPPPLSSLNHNGQPSFFLRPVRKNGRLELTEVRIDRPEILRASREDGRLRLHLITNQEVEEEEDDDADDDDDEEFEQEYEQEDNQELKEEVVEEEEEIAGEWRIPVTEEGLRRCHELVSHQHHHQSNHHHNLHVWSQHCVTTR